MCARTAITLVLIGLMLFGCIQQSQYNVAFPSSAATVAERGKLLWPIDCKPGVNCTVLYPDIDGDGKSACGPVSYAGHQGTDIALGNEVMDVWAMMDRGVAVRAAADGEVLWVFDGKNDRCENYQLPFIAPGGGPDCQDPTEKMQPNVSSGYLVCTDAGRYCKRDNPNGTCFWCFGGGNVVVIRHENMSGIFATRYDHLKNGSILVKPGDHVVAGQKIAEVGSAGRSSGPHLHFEVWSDFYEPIDPWPQDCGTDGLWQYS